MGRVRDLLLGPKPSEPRTPLRGRVPTSSLTFTLNAPEELFNQLTGVAEGLSRRVSRAEAMSVPAVKRARDLICGTLGTLPIRVHNRRREVVQNFLMEQPEPDVARTVTMTRTFEDMLFEERAWWRITGFAANGFPSQVRRLEPRSVQVRENARVYVARDGSPQGQAFEFVPDELLIRIDSPNDPLLVAGARAIRAALLLDQTAARNAKEQLPLGYFAPREGTDPGTKEEIEEYLDDWEDARARRAWGYVGAALEAKPLQWNPEQLELGAMRDHAVLEIARLAGIDPEDLGVSTTSRTYANAEQRRLDLLDFTLSAYVAAFESRMSMGDVTPSGQYVKFQYAGFLRSDTKTRMETYKLGREVGVYNDERIAELEDIPTARPSAPPRPAPSPEPVQQHQEATVHQLPDRHPVNFSTPVAEAEAHVSFVEDERIRETFRVNPEKRTISGLAVPWDQTAPSGFARWKFREGSLRWSDESRIKMLVDHDMSQPIGRAVRLQSTRQGLDATFKIARGAEGDRVLALAEDGVLDGMSVGIFFGEADDWQPDPSDESVRLVNRATLREVSITAMPAFDGARVASVTASQKGSTAMADTTVKDTVAGESATPESAEFTAFAESFGTKISETIGEKIAEAFAQLKLPEEHRQVIPAGRVTVTREAPVYAMDGAGPSFVRDAWKARTEDDRDARDRLAKFQAQTADVAEEARQVVFATGTTGTLPDVIPPGYRPDLYVTQLMKDRPLVNAISRGTLADATPFTLPRFVSGTGLAANHTEGTNPTDGTIDIETVTVTPGGVSGLYKLTREIVDSANPAIDAIAMQAMQQAYRDNTEAKVYAELNGANGQGGVITAGFVPSGAQASTTTGGSAAAGTFGGEELIAGIRGALALYPFRRFAAPDRMHLSQEGTQALSGAIGSDGRPLLPSVGAQNTAGVGNAVSGGWFVDGLAAIPTHSMTGNAAGDADVLLFNSNDAWAWESPLLTFRFEERSGPALIELALFGYFATRLLRPVGLAGIRHTVGA